jgi:hypothetical protein
VGDLISILGAASGGGSLIEAGIDAKIARDNMRMSRQALDEQKHAAAIAQSATVSQERRNEEARARAARKAPNIAAILLGEQELAGAPGATSLSGPRGVRPLNKTTLLGE